MPALADSFNTAFGTGRGCTAPAHLAWLAQEAERDRRWALRHAFDQLRPFSDERHSVHVGRVGSSVTAAFLTDADGQLLALRTAHDRYRIDDAPWSEGLAEDLDLPDRSTSLDRLAHDPSLRRALVSIGLFSAENMLARLELTDEQLRFLHATGDEFELVEMVEALAGIRARENRTAPEFGLIRAGLVALGADRSRVKLTGDGRLAQRLFPEPPELPDPEDMGCLPLGR